MNKRTIIIIVVLVLLVIAGFGYRMLGTSTAPQTNKTGEEKTDAEGLVKGTIKSLLSGGKNVTCSINYLQEGMGNGTIYVSGEKMRGDFNSNIEGKEMVSHVIYDEQYSYIWSDGETTGIKMKVDKDQLSPSPAEEDQNFDLDEEVDMKCSPWMVDNSKFTPPANVEFTDFSSMLEKIQQPTTAPAKTGASPCDSITDPQVKAACLNATEGQEE